MTSTKAIFACLFMVELIVSILLSFTSYRLLKLFVPWSDALVSTVTSLSALWLVHVTLRVFQMNVYVARNTHVYEQKSASKDCVNDFWSKMNRNGSTCSCGTEETKHEEVTQQPIETESITEVHKLLFQSAMKEHEHMGKICFNTLAVFVNVFAQCSIRFFILLHSINRSFRLRRQKSKTPKLSFYDIPFTMGKSMSLGGRSFFIFYFLDRWLDHGSEEFGDSSMALQSVSFDSVAFESSHLLMMKSDATGCRQLGLSLGGIEFKMTIHLKQNHGGKSPTKAGVALKAHLRSVSITVNIRMKSLRLTLFPVLHSVKVCGLKVEGNIDFETTKLYSNLANLANASNSTNVAGISMLHECNQINVQQFCLSESDSSNRFRTGSLLNSTIDNSKVISWDTLQSAFHIRETYDSSSQCTEDITKVVSLLFFPSGSVFLQTTSSSRQASVFVGKALGGYRDTDDICPNRLAVGLDVQILSNFILALNPLLQDTVRCTEGEIPPGRGKNNTERSPPIEIVAVDASFCSCFYAPCSNQRLEAFYFSTPNTCLCWRKMAELTAKGSILEDLHLPSDHVMSCLQTVKLSNANLRYCNNSYLDLVVLDEMKATLIDCSGEETSSPVAEKKYAIVYVGNLIVRIDDNTMMKGAQIKKATQQTIAAVNELKSKASQIKSSQTSNFATINNTTRRPFDRLKFSAVRVDAVFELQPPSGDNGASFNNACIRVAVLKRTILAQVRYMVSEETIEHCEDKLPTPERLFNHESQRHNSICVAEADVLKMEASVTFYSHAALPVIPPKSKIPKLETTFYGQAQGSHFKIAPETQTLFASIKELNAFELMGKSIPFFSIPLHNCLSLDEAIAVSDWPMLHKYNTDYQVNDKMAEILINGTVNVCRIERDNHEKNEKLELMSIQFSTGRSSPQLYWSTVNQWLQASCIDRVMQAIDYTKTSLSGSSTNRRYKSCKTQIRAVIESNVTPHFHISLGKKTKLELVIENGIDVNLSMEKYLCSEESTKTKGQKPNILLNAGRVLLSFNDLMSPTFVLGGICFSNITRRATSDEITSYLEKCDCSVHELDQEIVTDWNGHPTKENFDLKLDSCAAKFHPDLFFGEVIGEPTEEERIYVMRKHLLIFYAIDDFLLTPRALDVGLDSLKNSHFKRVRKYQLMSISFEASFVDISLLGDASPAGKKAQLTTNDLLLQDVARIYFEQIAATIQRDMPPSKTQFQISTLDEDSSLYSYGPQIQGGEVQLTIDHTVATLIPLNLLNVTLLRINCFDMGGLLFMAGLSPETPGIGEGKISHDLLLCHQCVSYGITSHSSGIPIKIYTDCKIACDALDINYGLIINESIPLLMECIQRLLPPPPELEEIDKTAPLTWWDNLRFFIHGNTSIHADKLSVKWLLDSQYMLHYAIWLTCNNFLLEYYLGYFGIVGSDLQVSVPGSSYDMSVHPSRRNRNAPKSYLLPHEVMVEEVREEMHPVIFFPTISIKVTITWKMLSSTKSTDHHCSYVKSDSSAHVEKFANFRSDGLSIVKYEMDLPGADLIGNFLLLRIDVLPWFTHVNSAIVHLKHSSNDTHEAQSYPQFRTVDISVQISELKLATWFSEAQDLSEWDNDIDEGVCITIKSLTYTSSNCDKKLIIEGPVKAALLDVSEFTNECIGHRLSDDDKEMSRTERACRNFGGRVTIYHEDDKDEIEMSKPIQSLFVKLQSRISHINELDYVATAGQIDIENKSLQSILAGRTSMGSDEFAGVYKTTWSILVSQLKILWTLNIRDSLIALTQDLLFTFGFMESQLRQSQLLAEEQATIETPIKNKSQHPVSMSNEIMQEGVEVALSLPTASRLEYLLKRSSSYYLDTDRISSDDRKITAQSNVQAEGRHENPSLPTIDIHFSNPQVQLLAATGASIILAMEGAHVEGRKFVRFLVDSQKVKEEVTPSDLTRRTVHAYTLTNMQAYSLNTRIDVTAGLPWLEVCNPMSESTLHVDGGDCLEELFGIAESDAYEDGKNCSAESQNKGKTNNDTHRYIYPPHLRHHEPLAFVRKGNAAPILDKFTFKSRQLFHRPPIHYSDEELLSFIKQGLVSKQDNDIVDEVDLNIDLLHFTLDSYQFKTTLDIIRNVLLEPPKLPRYRNFHREENNPTTPSNLMTRFKALQPLAALEMEEILANTSDGFLHGKQARETLRAAAMNLLRDLEDRRAVCGEEITRRIKYNLKKLTWSIHSQEDLVENVYDEVEISFTGFFGRHDYFSDGSVSTQIGLEDVRVSSFKPGPDSIVFPDPTSIMKPVLDGTSPCVYCGKQFDQSQNNLRSCSYHDGEFKFGYWSCCRAIKEAPGCTYGPHSGRERAVLIRVETLPRIVEGITLYSHIEAQIFPQTSYVLTAFISKSLSKLFMNYFFIEDDEVTNATTTTTKSADSEESTSIQSDNTSRPQKTLLIGGKGSPRASSKTEDDGSEFETEAIHPRPELVLIKVWRVGYINAEISLAGFRRIPRRTVEIRVHDYSKAYKIGTWAYLGRKYLSFLVQETLKSGASSAIFRRKVAGAVAEAESIVSKSTEPLGYFRPRPQGAETFLGSISARQSRAKTKGSKH